MSNGIGGGDSEREVKKILERRGWVVLRVAGSGTEQGDSCDLVAMKGKQTLLVEVKTYSNEDEVVDCIEDMLQLRRMREKINDCHSIFAHRKKWNRTWYYEDSEQGAIDPSDDHDGLEDFLIHIENDRVR